MRANREATDSGPSSIKPPETTALKPTFSSDIFGPFVSSKGTIPESKRRSPSTPLDKPRSLDSLQDLCQPRCHDLTSPSAKELHHEKLVRPRALQQASPNSLQELSQSRHHNSEALLLTTPSTARPRNPLGSAFRRISAAERALPLAPNPSSELSFIEPARSISPPRDAREHEELSEISSRSFLRTPVESDHSTPLSEHAGERELLETSDCSVLRTPTELSELYSFLQDLETSSPSYAPLPSPRLLLPILELSPQAIRLPERVPSEDCSPPSNSQLASAGATINPEDPLFDCALGFEALESPTGFPFPFEVSEDSFSSTVETTDSERSFPPLF